MAHKLPDYLRKIEKISSKKGWDWQYRGSKHVMVFDPQGVAVTNVSLTQYDGTLRKKTLSQLKRAGCPGVCQ
jgi:hypothetical protein